MGPHHRPYSGDIAYPVNQFVQPARLCEIAVLTVFSVVPYEFFVVPLAHQTELITYHPRDFAVRSIAQGMRRYNEGNKMPLNRQSPQAN